MSSSQRYLLNKIGWALLTILFVMVLNFFLFRILPGDPARAGIRDPRLKREAVEAIRVRFGLDKPVINCFETLNPLKTGSCTINPLQTQFFIYIKNLLRFDLGYSYHSNRPVIEVIAERMWNSFLLLSAGEVLSIFIGITIGVIAAWKVRTAVDYSSLIGSLVAWSLPTFWLGIILLFIGSRYFNLPIGGKFTPGMHYQSTWEYVLDVARHLFLPTLTFTIVLVGEYMLIMRSTMIEVLSEDYILTAKAKGLNAYNVLRNHALPNSMLPMVTIIALNLGFTVAGAIQIETVFSWPGIGSTIYEAVGRRDYPMLQGAFLIIAISVVLANLIADLTYSYLDPRVRAG